MKAVDEHSSVEKVYSAGQPQPLTVPMAGGWPVLLRKQNRGGGFRMDMVTLTFGGALVSSLIGDLSSQSVLLSFMCASTSFLPLYSPEQDRLSLWNVTAPREHQLAPHLVKSVCSNFSRLELLVCWAPWPGVWSCPGPCGILSSSLGLLGKQSCSPSP